MSTKEITLPVQGMTCASCVAHVEGALRKVEGVSEASVNLAAERATVAVDGEQAETRDLVEAVAKTAYQIPVERVELRIGGMTCVSCMAHVEGALSDVPGVVEVSVNLANEKASVGYVPEVASLEDFRHTVAKLGYQVLGTAEE